MNQYYSAELSQKVLRGLRESYLKGNYTGGPVLFGYDVVDKKNVVNPTEGAIVQEIFGLYAQDYTAAYIAEEMRKRGIRTKKGKYLTEKAIYKMLQNTKYNGYFDSRRREWVQHKNEYKTKRDIDQTHYTGRVERGQAGETFYYALYEYEDVNGRVIYIQPRDTFLTEEKAQLYGELNPTIDILTDGESYICSDTSEADIYIGYIGPSILMLICYVLSGLCFLQMAKAIRWEKEMKAMKNSSVGQ